MKLPCRVVEATGEKLALYYCEHCRATHSNEWPWTGPVVPKCPPGTGLWTRGGYLFLEPIEEDPRQVRMFE